MKRSGLAVLAGLCLAAAGVAAAPAPQAQDWRATAVASFDAAWQTINETFPDPVVRRHRLGRRPTGIAAARRGRCVSRCGARRHSRDARATEAIAFRPAVDDRRRRAAGIILRARRRAHLRRGRDRDAGHGSRPARDAGLHAGQAIVTIDGTDVAALVRRAEGADPRTKNLNAWRRVNQHLYGADNSTAVLNVRDADGTRHDLRVQRTPGAGETVKLGNLPPLRVAFEEHEARTPAGRRAGVIWFSVWMTPVSDPFERAIDKYRRADGLVIDLRGNPGGLAAMMRGISGHFVDRPLVLGTMHTRQADLSFTVNPRTATSDGRSVKPFAGPVAILIDELTGSTSETFAGGLQSLGRVRVFGRPSMGQALPALTRELPNGDVLMYAVGDFITSTGKRLEGDGVIPDTIVPLSVKALAAGKDEPLDAALRWFDTATRRP